MDLLIPNRQEDVRRLEIAVNHAAVVRRGHGFSNRHEDVCGLCGRQETRVPEPTGEILAFEHLHRQKAPLPVISHLDDVDDVRVSDTRRQPCLRQKARARPGTTARFGLQDPERDAPPRCPGARPRRWHSSS